MTTSKKIRVYNLAKTLKQAPKRIIEDIQREGVNIEVASNSVSIELAEKIRNKYLSKVDNTPRMGVKVIKNVITPNSENTINNSQKRKMCEYCSKIISRKHFVKQYKQHVINECPKKPVLSNKNLLKYFDLMTEKTNLINNTNLTSTKFASYLIGSELVSNFNVNYSPIHHFSPDNRLIATVTSNKKKLKLVIINELFNIYYPCRIKLDIHELGASYVTKLRPRDFEIVHERLVKVANLFVKLKNGKNIFQETQNQRIYKVEETDWDFFPVGDWFTNKTAKKQLFDHFQKIHNKGKWQNKFFDESRIDGIIDKLNPNTFKTGKRSLKAM